MKRDHNDENEVIDLSCVFHTFGDDMNACAIIARCNQATGNNRDTTCPHDGEGDECGFIKEKVAEAHDA